jgi:molybdate/tungstate transport system ATP-binding protein
LTDVNLHVAKGEFFALMGPTGSGKTLILESIAGLVKQQTGVVHIAGRDVTRLPPERRRVSLVYQDHALFPHLSVLENVEYGQRYHGATKTEGRREALALLDRLGLSTLAGRTPEHLSGGEKQRVSLARALACRPDVALLDEPLSSLDPQFRDSLRATLKSLHRDLGLTFFMVTHDFVDVLTLADRGAVIRQGKMEQVGSVEDIFRKPATPFVAAFVGMRNIFPLSAKGVCSLGEGTFFQVENGQGSGSLALRPEDVFIAPTPSFPEDWTTLPGVLLAIRHEGFSWFAEARCGAATVIASLDRQALQNGAAEPGTPVYIGFSPKNAHVMAGAPQYLAQSNS